MADVERARSARACHRPSAGRLRTLRALLRASSGSRRITWRLSHACEVLLSLRLVELLESLYEARERVPVCSKVAVGHPEFDEFQAFLLDQDGGVALLTPALSKAEKRLQCSCDGSQEACAGEHPLGSIERDQQRNAQSAENRHPTQNPVGEPASAPDLIEVLCLFKPTHVEQLPLPFIEIERVGELLVRRPRCLEPIVFLSDDDSTSICPRAPPRRVARRRAEWFAALIDRSWAVSWPRRRSRCRAR